MGVLWPVYLLVLITIPLVVLAYLLVLKRRKRFAVHYSSLSLIQQAMPGHTRWRRHLPFALLVLALTLLILALSRPFANVSIASSRTTVMLALDVSLSMCANDISPNRLTIAQEAARRFIESQEPDTQVGIVVFAGIAQLIVPPTTDRDVLLGGGGQPIDGAPYRHRQRYYPLSRCACRGEPGDSAGEHVRQPRRRPVGP